MKDDASFEDAMKMARCCDGTDAVEGCVERDCDRCLSTALDELQSAYDRDMRNPSLAYSLKSSREDSMKLAGMREYDRGYSDGKKAKDADGWVLEQERNHVASRLANASIGEMNDEGMILRVMTRAICDVDPKWSTSENARMIVDSLLHLLVGKERNYDTKEKFCERHGWCGMGSGACDGCDVEWHRLAVEGDEDGCNRTGDGVCVGDTSCDCDSSRVGGRAVSQKVTDELREWACTKVPYKYGHQLMSIANRIDETFARVCEIWERTATETARKTYDCMDSENERLVRAAERDADTIELLGMQLEDAVMERDSLLDLLRDAAEEYMELDRINNDIGATLNAMRDRAWGAESERDTLQEKANLLLDECREKSDRIMQLQEELVETRNERDQLHAMQEGSIPATEENMEECGWVRKERLDKALGEIKGLRLSIKEQHESILRRKKEIKNTRIFNRKLWDEIRSLHVRLGEIENAKGCTDG